MTYDRLSDRRFLQLIFTSEDRLGFDYMNESQRRRSTLVPLLCDVVAREENYLWDDQRCWGVIHAVYLLGILGDPRSLDALTIAGELADRYDLDWISEALPECYLRMGQEAIPELEECVNEFRKRPSAARSGIIQGLWNLWDAYPRTRTDIEDFLLGVMKDPDTDSELRAELIADFAQIGRTDLKLLFEGLFERDQVDSDTLGREELGCLFDEDDRAPGCRFDLEGFYAPAEIEGRQRRWREEAAADEQRAAESYILERHDSIEGEAQCPCGSGQRYGECHLSWAAQELSRLRQEERRLTELRAIRSAISAERRSETALRMFLARKGEPRLFADIRETVLKSLKAPQDELATRRLSARLGPIVSKIECGEMEEVEEFAAVFMDYYKALARQYGNSGGEMSW